MIGLGEEMNHAHVRACLYKLPVWLLISPASKCGASGQGQSPEHFIVINLGHGFAPCSHIQASELLLASGKSVFSVQAVQGVSPAIILYLPATHPLQLPPSLPVYPELRVQSV